MRSVRSHHYMPCFWLLAVLLTLAPCHAQTATDTVDASLPLDYWFFSNEDQGSDLGIAVSSAGNIDNDSFDDILVGAPKASAALDQSGAVYVFHGAASGPSPTPDMTLSGTSQGELFGASVSFAGDVNGDDYGDVIVGAPGYNIQDTQKPNAGAFYVYMGGWSGLNSTPEIFIAGENPDDLLGAEVAGAGDINNDGYDDVLVGVPQYGASNHGQIRIYFGSDTGVLTGTSEIQVIDGDTPAGQFGAAIAGAGDVNGDGNADVIVGAPYYERDGLAYGAAFLFLGSDSGLIAPPVWVAYGEQPVPDTNHDLLYGSTVGTAGDINGDNYDDWFVGARGYDGAHIDEGLVQVFYGSPTTPGTAIPPWTHTGGVTGAQFGAGADTAGDVNDDGYADIIVGTPYYYKTPDGSAQDEPEAAFIYLGSASGLKHLHAWKLTCNQSTTDFGITVSAAGDTNNDGFDDVLVGAPEYKREEHIVQGRSFGYPGTESDGTSFEVYLPLVIRQP